MKTPENFIKEIWIQASTKRDVLQCMEEYGEYCIYEYYKRVSLLSFIPDTGLNARQNLQQAETKAKIIKDNMANEIRGICHKKTGGIK